MSTNHINRNPAVQSHSFLWFNVFIQSLNRLDCSANRQRPYGQEYRERQVSMCCPASTNQLPPRHQFKAVAMEMRGWRAALPSEKDVSHPVLVTSLPLGGAFVEKVDRPLVNWKHTNTLFRNPPDWWPQLPSCTAGGYTCDINCFHMVLIQAIIVKIFMNSNVILDTTYGRQFFSH